MEVGGATESVAEVEPEEAANVCELSCSMADSNWKNKRKKNDKYYAVEIIVAVRNWCESESNQQFFLQPFSMPA